MQNFDALTHRSPFVESPFYKSLSLKIGDNKFKKYTDALNKDGYCIFDPKIDLEIIDRANSDLDELVKQKNFKTNSAEYHYNESPRIVEAWKDSEAIKSLATNKNVMDFLKHAYNSKWAKKKGIHSWVVRLEDLFVKPMKDQKSLCHAIQVSSLWFLQPGGKLYYRSCAEIYEITQSVVATPLGSHTKQGSDPSKRVGKWREHPQTFDPSLLDHESKKALTRFGYM